LIRWALESRRGSKEERSPGDGEYRKPRVANSEGEEEDLPSKNEGGALGKNRKSEGKRKAHLSKNPKG
jgi:hypothetical protein